MTLPNPALTFQQTAIFTCASTAKTDVIDAIEAAINSLTGDHAWTAGTIDGDVADTPATLIAAPSGSPIIASFRAIFGFGNGTLPLAAEMKSPDSRLSEGGVISIGPDGRTGTNNWYDPDPYGSGNRNSELWRAAAVTTVTKVWCIASEETLVIVLRGASDAALSMFYLGAIVDPCDSDSHEADERIYGLASSGSNALSTTWSKSVLFESPLFNSVTNGQAHFGVYNPVSPTAWIDCQINMLPDDAHTTTASSLGGNKYLVPAYVWKQLGSNKEYDSAVGRLRGVYFYEHALCRTVLQDSTPADQGYVVSADLGVANDSFIWANE